MENGLMQNSPVSLLSLFQVKNVLLTVITLWYQNHGSYPGFCYFVLAPKVIQWNSGGSQISPTTFTLWFLNMAAEETECELTKKACVRRDVAAGRSLTGGKKGGEFNVKKHEVSCQDWLLSKNRKLCSQIDSNFRYSSLHLHHNYPALVLQSIICVILTKLINQDIGCHHDDWTGLKGYMDVLLNIVILDYSLVLF